MNTSRSSNFGLFSWTLIKKVREFSALGYSGDTKGDGNQLGGCWIFNEEGQMIYEFKQSSYTDHPDVEELKSVVAKHFPVQNEAMV